MWFSVWMCAGMAAELGSTASSWTLRSKICEPEGELNRGEDGMPTRPGEEGIVCEALPTLEDDGSGWRLEVSTSPRGMEVGAEVVVSCAVEVWSLSVFFLPNPKRPRFLDLPSAVVAEKASGVDSVVSLED